MWSGSGVVKQRNKQSSQQASHPASDGGQQSGHHASGGGQSCVEMSGKWGQGGVQA